MSNQEGEHTPEQPDFEFEAVTYANEWELWHWGDEQGKKLVDKSFRDGIKLSRAEQAWNLVASQSSELSKLRELVKRVADLGISTNHNQNQINVLVRDANNLLK